MSPNRPLWSIARELEDLSKKFSLFFCLNIMSGPNGPTYMLSADDGTRQISTALLVGPRTHTLREQARALSQSHGFWEFVCPECGRPIDVISDTSWIHVNLSQPCSPDHGAMPARVRRKPLTGYVAEHYGKDNEADKD